MNKKRADPFFLAAFYDECHYVPQSNHMRMSLLNYHERITKEAHKATIMEKVYETISSFDVK